MRDDYCLPLLGKKKKVIPHRLLVCLAFFFILILVLYMLYTF